MTDDIENLFVCLFAIHICSLVKCLFKFPPIFFFFWLNRAACGILVTRDWTQALSSKSEES